MRERGPRASWQCRSKGDFSYGGATLGCREAGCRATDKPAEPFPSGGEGPRGEIGFTCHAEVAGASEESPVWDETKERDSSLLSPPKRQGRPLWVAAVMPEPSQAI